MGVVVSSPFRCAHPSSTSSISVKDAEFERLFTKSFHRRYSKWCRLCVGETCHHDSKISQVNTQTIDRESQLSSSETDVRNRLLFIKQKRQNVLSFLQNAENISDSCRLKIARQSYFGPEQYGIPLSLMEALSYNSVLTFHLVPLFPTTKENVQEISSQVFHFPGLDSDVSYEYFVASQSEHRVRLSMHSIAEQNTLHDTSFSVLEDIYKLSIQDEDELPLSLNDEIGTEKQSPNSNTSQTSFNQGDVHNIKCTDKVSGQNRHKNIEKQWKTLFECQKTSFVEGRFGRISIKGDFYDHSFSKLPFHLIIFPGQRSSGGSVFFSGTFIRKMESSKFSLRWKFQTEVKVC